MLRSRVTRGLDVTRLANAVSRPGIDPRIWVSYAVLQTEPFVDERPGKQGVFADVQLLPSGVMDTARVGAIYAGNGFGLYAPLHKDDEVLVCAPSGDPDEGLVIVQRLWSTSDPQPAQVAQTPEDVTLVVEPDKNLRLTVQGSGNVYITAAGGKVVLGEESATRGVARLEDATVNGTLELKAITIPLPPPAPPNVAITLTYTPPGGGLPMTSTVTLAVATLVSSLGSIDLSGKIDSASEKVVSI